MLSKNDNHTSLGDLYLDYIHSQFNDAVLCSIEVEFIVNAYQSIRDSDYVRQLFTTRVFNCLSIVFDNVILNCKYGGMWSEEVVTPQNGEPKM